MILRLHFTFQTDRHINVEDDESDTSSTISNNDVDVKEALRSSISLNLKSKFQKGLSLFNFKLVFGTSLVEFSDHSYLIPSNVFYIAFIRETLNPSCIFLFF